MRHALFLTLTLALTPAFARGPAVEDFVGIESETPDATPTGTEALFNFSQDMEKAKSPTQTVVRHPTPATSTNATGFPVSVWFAVGLVFALPVATWAFMRRQALKHAVTTNNVTPLPMRSKDDQDKYKKAS